MNILVAIAAGCAAGLMFASLVSGALISLLLFNLAPLPLMVAALGWGPASALIGAVTAGAGLGLAFGLAYFAAFIIAVGLPAFWLGHLALLAKPAAAASDMNGSSPAPAAALEWYPPGRLLLWIGACAGLTTLSTLLTLGGDYEAIMAALGNGLKRFISAQTGGAVSTDNDQMLEAVIQVAPAMATIVSMFTLSLNLWLSGKIVAQSGRLRRPWPDLHAIELPQTGILVLAAALALSFTGGLLAMVSQMAGAALLAAYMLVGFAVLHVLAPLFGGRWGLTGAYASIVLLRWWPLLLVILLGLIEGAVGLRKRFATSVKPPTLSP
jgi:hypothetical protein